MNHTTEQLKAQYTARFLVTAACICGAVIAVRLILLGKTGDLLSLVGIALLGGYLGWKGFLDLCGRWLQLKQVDILQNHAPYDTHEFVPPHEADRKIGGDADRNMWGAPGGAPGGTP